MATYKLTLEDGSTVFVDENNNPVNPLNFGESDKGKVRKGIESFVKSPALPVAGAVGFGLAGTPGGPAAIPMAGLGGAFGESVRQLSARGLGIDAPKTSMQAAKKIATEGAISLIGEGAGQAIFKGGAFALKNTLGRLGPKTIDALSASTGVPKTGFENLIRRPGLFLRASKSAVDKQGKQIGSIIDNLITKEMSPSDAATSLVERAFRTSSGSRNVAKKVALKMALGEQVTQNEVALANRAISKVIVNTPDPASKALLQEQKKVFQTFLSENVPELKKANQAFSELKSVSQFRNIGRLNKAGDSSRLGAMFLALAIKNPLILATSPVVVGSLLAAGAGTSKALASPVVQSGAAQIAARSPIFEKFSRRLKDRQNVSKQ